MSVCTNTKLLLDADGVTADTTGTTYEIVRHDPHRDPAEEWAFVGSITQADTGGGATAVLYAETSPDGTNWVRLPITGAATDDDETLYFVMTASQFCRYVRIWLDVATGTPTITAKCWIITNSDDYSFRTVA